jgi:thymidylate synthase
MEETAYLQLLQKILVDGEERTGRNGLTKSVFGEKLEFNVCHGFPLLTTKRMFWRGIVEELLWFLRGSTDANELKERGVFIWNGNSTREFLDTRGLSDYCEGECGPIYGYQWRCFDGDYPSRSGGIDQLRYVLKELTDNPSGRRALMTGWNPKQLDAMCLPPCHVLYNFYLSPKSGLSCQMYQRSCDTCAGLPFNIASTALLTSIIATAIGVAVDRVIIVIGDTHVYEQHYTNALEQIGRTPFAFPQLRIDAPPDIACRSLDEKIAWIEGLTMEQFELLNYKCHPSIKYDMVA